MGGEPASGGIRTVSVPLRRLERWLDGFVERHGPWSVARSADPPGWAVRARDGAQALVREPPWWVEPPGLRGEGDAPAGVPDPAHAAEPLVPAALQALVHAQPRYGVLLIRRAGYAVAAFHGDQVLDRKVGSRHVHGRTAAGGWSQQRYARRRDNQADEIVGAAAAAAGRILGPTRPDALVTGGDRRLVAEVLDRLDRALAALPVVAHLEVGTPDSRVLAGIPDRVLAVRIDVVDP